MSIAFLMLLELIEGRALLRLGRSGLGYREGDDPYITA